jgi:hypothetical protein
MWPFRRAAPPAEQLGRACRQLGDLLLTHASAWGNWSEVTVEFTRHMPGDLPAVHGRISRRAHSEALEGPADLAAISSSLAALGGNYSKWQSVAVRFRPDQLPIPVGISIRPAQNE